MVGSDQIRAYLVELNLLPENGSVDPDESLFDGGYLDSLGIMALTSLLERQFGIIVSEEDLLPDNFDSIASIARYANSKLRVAN